MHKIYNYEKARESGMSFSDFVKLVYKYDRPELTTTCKLDAKIEGTDDFVRLLESHKNDKVRIIGDYDVDGVASTVIMMKALRQLGYNIDYYVPNRFTDGYGLNVKIVEKAKADNVKCLITVDNGIKAFDAIEKAKASGMTVLLTDHHQPDEKLPAADVIINPHACKSNLLTKDVCGATVAYLVAKSLFSDEKWSEIKNDLVEFAAIATVTDVMPLVYENRLLVKVLINKAKNNRIVNDSISRLLSEMKISKYSFDTESVSFGIGPCLNAPGRLQTADSSIEYLLGDLSKLSTLIELNGQRKSLTSELKAKSEEILSQKSKNRRSNVVFLDGASEGIIGIIAGKLTEDTGLPSFVFTNTENGFVKGSGRAPSGFDLLANAKKTLDGMDKSLVIGYGGHCSAMGLSLKDKSTIDVFEKSFEKAIKNIEIVKSDSKAIRMPNDLSLEDASKIVDSFEPYGNGNESPTFVVKTKIYNVEQLGDNHVKVGAKLNNTNTTFYYFFKNYEEVKKLRFKDVNIYFKVHKNCSEKTGKTTFSPYVEAVEAL